MHVTFHALEVDSDARSSKEREEHGYLGWTQSEI